MQDPSGQVVRDVVTRPTSLTLSAVDLCSCHGLRLRATSCYWCGGPADPVAGAYLERLYPGRTTCRNCGRLQVQCSCTDYETVARDQAATVHRLALLPLPMSRDVAPASETERRAGWGDR